MDRYSRQSVLIGKENQNKLGKSTVLIVGLGGTGCITSELLARAGVNLILFESDKVSESDLHRQILFMGKDIGKKKAEVARDLFKEINSGIKVDVFTEKFADNGEEQVKKADLVLDCTDDLITRQIINKICFEHEKPWIYSGAIKWRGMVMPISPKGKPCFKCLVKTEDIECFEDRCDEVGVMGPVANAIGALASSEAIKVLIGKANYGKLHYCDFEKNKFETLEVKARKDCGVCGSKNL